MPVLQPLHRDAFELSLTDPSRVSLGAALLVGASFASAQVFTPPSAFVPRTDDTGWAHVEGPSGGAIARREVVHQFTITQPGADWIRLHFGDVTLAGDLLAGNGAQLRLTGHLDGAEQLLDAITLAQWRNSSAYFNGASVEVEVLAFPGSGASRVTLRSIETSLPMPQFSQCGPTDDRILSSDPRSARLLPIGCTGWLINDCAGCFLTAGHCQGNIQVVQFNVPLSTSSGSLVHPPPSDQYATDSASLQGNGGQGTGNDWAYFGAFANSTTGLTPSAAQGPGFTLVAPPAVGSAQIRITGFGTDSTPQTSNQVQQTHVGPLVTSTSTLVQYQTDTTGGNSGSPVIWEQTGQAVGIHTHGGCNTSGTGQNSGTSFTHPGLQAALAAPEGICAGGIGTVDGPSLIAPATAAQVLMNTAGNVVPGTAMLHYRAGNAGLFTAVPMTAASGGAFVANLPGFACGDTPQYYTSAQFAACGLLTSPTAGPSGPYQAEVGVESVAFADDFQTDRGWTTSATATSGQWQRGVPVNDPSWAYDPSTDGDGSGSCYLTQNTAGNTDVDNGSVTLDSPRIDRSSGGELRFWYYLELTNETGVDALECFVSDDDGASWNSVRRFTMSSGGWRPVVVTAAEIAAASVVPSPNTRLRFVANDDNPQSIVEAGVDGIFVGAITCDPTAIGTPYCTAVANSTGSIATLRANGSVSVAANDVTLRAGDLPSSVLGYFLVAPTQAFVPAAGGSIGNLCLGLPLGRYAGNVLSSGAAGTFTMVVDLTSLPQPLGSVGAAPGETWNFQAWYRDNLIGVPTSNFSRGLSLTLQ